MINNGECEACLGAPTGRCFECYSLDLEKPDSKQCGSSHSQDSKKSRRQRLLDQQEKMETDALYNGDLKPCRNISFSTVGRGRETGY